MSERAEGVCAASGSAREGRAEGECLAGAPAPSEHPMGEQAASMTRNRPLSYLSAPARLDLPATRAQLAGLRVGVEVRLHGAIYTMRDAGHRRALDHLVTHGELPFDLKGQALFYAGPTPAAAGRPFGAIGPTTASRMDFATPQLLHAGITVMLGKGNRSPAVVAACRETGSVYLAATGGAAAYLAGFVTAAEPVAWDDLGTEALCRLTLDGFPAFVAIDACGANLYQRERGVG